MSVVKTKQPKSNMDRAKVEFRKQTKIVQMKTPEDAFAWGWCLGQQELGKKVFDHFIARKK